MSFDFEAFIAGTDLPKFQIPLYRVVNQRRIYELEAKIDAATKSPSGDEREVSVSPVNALTEERDRLLSEQEDSAQWVELRALSADEFATVSADEKMDILDQIAAQSQGTSNEADRERWAQIKAAALPGAWTLFVARANEILEQTLVMPDFSLTGSKNQSQPDSSAS